MNMHESFYGEEVKAVSNIYNRKTVLQNFVYKLNLDSTIKEFLTQLPEKAKNYDNLERMEHFYFIGKLKAYHKILHHLFTLMECVEVVSSKTADEISENCRVLPDSTGKELLFFLGYLPLLDAIKKKSEFLEFFKKQKEEISDDMREHYEAKLFNKNSWHFKHFPSEKALVDRETLNRKVELEKELYESEVKPELDPSISMLSDIIIATKPEELRALMIDLGKKYWDAKKEAKDKRTKGLSEAITALANGLAKKTNQDK